MKNLWILALMLVGFFSCKEDDTTDVVDTFDKEAMLSNVANNVIIPSYKTWKDDATALLEASENFSVDRSEGNLSALRSAFLEAYKSWNICSIYEFGPAAERNLRLAINTFPVDTAQINANISAGSYDLNSAQNSDANGYPAIDYLLYNDVAVLLNDPKQANYIQSNIQLIYDRASELNESWSSYNNEFASNTSSSAGSSISNLINELNYEFELLKNARIGIPMGKKSLGVTQIEKLEGFYSGYSTELAIENVKGIIHAFTGGEGTGLDDYLDDINAQKDGVLLSVSILRLFNEIEDDLEPFNLKTTIQENPSELDPVYNKIEQLVVLLKTDMTSQLGVQITYQDNDGD